MPDSGMVFLVGAGPGDPGLLTLKGRQCLGRADVVVYDYLASDELLEFAPAQAERIYVGKQAARHAMEQHEINALLVEKAKAGKVVVRLKGGDPYVFGRGGEEAIALWDAGIPVQVVPGVTSGVAAPAYAGIPVTHRGFNSVLTLVTGHEDPTKEQSELNWPALAAGGGTLVFYMGVKNLPNIVHKLTEAGRPPETPIALVRWGTLPVQRVVDGTLSNIVERVNQAGLTPPCIIVVGEVVGLRPKLNWFESQPLFGKTILITRSREQSSEFAEKLSGLGARVLQFHTIQFQPPASEEPLRACVNRLDQYDWIVFTSVNAVDRFFAVLVSQGRDSRSLAGCKVCCIGPGTQARLMEQGIRADLVPGKFTSAGVLEALARQNEIHGKRFLLPRADIAGKDLPEQLAAGGATVCDVETYRTVPGTLTDGVREALASGQVDIVTFTSSSTARNYASIVRQALGQLPDKIKYASIGPETSKAARDEGMTVEVEAAEHTIDGLVAAIEKTVGQGPPYKDMASKTMPCHPELGGR